MFTRILASSLLFASVALTSCPVAAAEADNDIALQMYTLRNVGSADKQFAMAHEAGFKNVEIVGTHDLSAKQMQALLAKNQLKVTSAHVQLSALESAYAQTLAFNKAVGNKTLIVPWIEAEDRPTDSQGWIDYAKRLDRLGAKLRKDGMQLGYHNHNFEMKKYDGVTALEIIMNHTQPENLKLEMDAAWVSRGGQDPVRFLKEYPGRIYAIHAKDNAAIGIRDDEMNFAPLGEGLLDWQTILPAAKASGVKWFIIEHDKPNDPWSIITTSLRNLRAALSH
ncbi:sugar phosphate isomerase/epimerase [Rahnella sp. BIGb0236]|uniref:sugar phosphate isomerase/epimerase family protein n=1 Tax=Rahnella TaxID=34037 RepID=UPI000BB1F3AB|nr:MULTISPECIES: sugar phosphate isomerase/epimerase [Rahnella]PBI78818.1 xylose isomerase [Rahnella victoriana]TDS90189.1 sugar phosphate isomerase/epimerase [Rahnella sp. BIGb0236]